MKKTLFVAAMAAIALTAAVTPSCKKSDGGGDSRAAMLVGTWKTTEEGVDSNANGTWDASEHHTIAASDAQTVIFNADGNGSTAVNFGGFPVTLPIQWALLNNDNDLRIIVNFAGTVDTGIANIITLTSSDGVLRDAGSSPASYTAFKKQ